MKITDLNGMEITVTDLPRAIAQAEEYTHYDHSSGMSSLARKQKCYWEDIYQKLIALRQENMD